MGKFWRRFGTQFIVPEGWEGAVVSSTLLYLIVLIPLQKAITPMVPSFWRLPVVVMSSLVLVALVTILVNDGITNSRLPPSKKP